MSMDAVEFVKQLRRMDRIGKRERSLWDLNDSPEDVVAEVEQWVKENSIKTRQSEFLKMFPNVMLNSDGQPYMCPRTLDTAYQPDGNCAIDVDICQRCKAKFWDQEVEA